MKYKIKGNFNKHQKEFFDDDTSNMLHLSGGYGCVREDSKILTINGEIEAGSISKPTYYYSLSPLGPVWSLGIAPYAKQKDDLYRVVHEQGEFVCSLSHLSFCADYKYRPLAKLSVGDYLYTSYHIQQPTILEPYQSEFLLNAQSYLQTLSSYLDDCSSYYHQYGQQLRQEVNSVPIFLPLQGDVQELDHSFYSFLSSNKDGLEERLLKYNHHDLSFYQLEKNRSCFHKDRLASFLEDLDLEQFFEHTLQNIQQLKKSLLMNECHPKEQLSYQHIPDAFETVETSFVFNSESDKKFQSKILSIEKISHDWVWDTHVFGTNNYATGGAIHHNSGKTHILCKKLLKLSFQNKDKHGGMVCPTYKDFKRDVYIEMENILNQNNIKCKYNNQDHYFTFPWTKGRLYVASAENPLRGPNWAYAGINEVTMISLIRYKEVIGRVRLKNASNLQIVSVGTPEGFASEYYEYFIEKPPTGFKIIYGLTDDNMINLHENYTTNLENSYDEKMLAAYRKGLWVNMGTNQFYYSFNPAKQFDRSINRDQFETYVLGLDFNISPFCAGVWGFDGYKLYGVDEIKLEGAEGFSTENMITAMKARGYTPDNTVIYPDPAGRARSTKGLPDITVLKNNGYTVNHRNMAPSFRRRQLNVNNLLDKGRIKLNPDKMPGTKKDLEAVEQDIITLEKKKNNPNLTHFSDSLDYICDILFPFSGTHKPITVETLR